MVSCHFIWVYEFMSFKLYNRDFIVIIILLLYIYVCMLIFICIVISLTCLSWLQRQREDWLVFIITLKKSTRFQTCDTIIFSFLLAFHWSPEWKVIIEHKRSVAYLEFTIWCESKMQPVSLKRWKILSTRRKKKETSVLYRRYITCFTCFSRKIKSRLKRKQRIKSDKKVRRDAKDSMRKQYAKIYLIKGVCCRIYFNIKNVILQITCDLYFF